MKSITFSTAVGTPGLAQEHLVTAHREFSPASTGISVISPQDSRKNASCGSPRPMAAPDGIRPYKPRMARPAAPCVTTIHICLCDILKPAPDPLAQQGIALAIRRTELPFILASSVVDAGPPCFDLGSCKAFPSTPADLHETVVERDFNGRGR